MDITATLGVFCRLVGIAGADEMDVALYFLHQLFLWTEKH